MELPDQLCFTSTQIVTSVYRVGLTSDHTECPQQMPGLSTNKVIGGCGQISAEEPRDSPLKHISSREAGTQSPLLTSQKPVPGIN